MWDATREADLTDSRGYGQWDAAGNAPHESWSQYLLDVANDHPTKRTHGWRTALASSTVGDRPFRLAYERLRELAVGLPNHRQLIHSDLLNRNVLVADDRIVAVFDWGNAEYGDALYDLAWFSYWSPYYPAMEDIAWEEEAHYHLRKLGVELPDFERRLLTYKIHIGLGAQAYTAFIKDWKELAVNAKRTLALAEQTSA